jgi:hypothetical protein
VLIFRDIVVPAVPDYRAALVRKLALQCPPYRPPPSCASAISRSASCSLPHPNVCTCQVRPVRWLQSVAASALERPTAHAHLPNRRNARSVRGAPSNDTRTDGRLHGRTDRGGAGPEGEGPTVQCSAAGGHACVRRRAAAANSARAAEGGRAAQGCAPARGAPPKTSARRRAARSHPRSSRRASGGRR